jgi:hypothetical protein
VSNKKVIPQFTQAAWREQLIIFLISSNLPFRAVEHPEFRKAMLMLRPDLDIPHRTYIRTHLTSLYENVQSQLLSDLPESAKVSIALDGWQSPFNKSFLAVTAYYITTDWQWKEVRYMLYPIRVMLTSIIGTDWF